MKLARYILLALAVVAVVLLAVSLPLQSQLLALVDWSQDHLYLTVLAFFGLTILAMVLLFPVSIQAMAAGFLFGLKMGFVIMWVAGLAGFVAAFLVGRGVARPLIRDWAQRRPEFIAIDRAIGGNGLVLVILARLAQILPYNLLNYSFGLTSVTLRDYILGSAVGMLPGIFVFVLVGTTATDIASVISGQVQMGDLNLWLAALGVLVLAFAVVLIPRIARKALRDQLETRNRET